MIEYTTRKSGCVISNNFYDNYNSCKKSVIDNIYKEQNIVLYGSGNNGKTYLVNELNELLLEHEYFMVKELGPNNSIYDWNNFIKKNNVKKWIVCINDKNVLESTLSQSFYMFINMNGYKWPGESYLRSGRNFTTIRK